jgi:abortive infection bacteriophage resistance protein
MSNKIKLKPALTIDQQIELLKSKGLFIDREDEAGRFLLENNYYRLNVYFHKLMDTRDHFKTGTNFSDIINIYNNDSFLRQQLFSLLEPIEINIKSKIAYYLATKYGSDVFYQKEVYKSSQKHDQIFALFQRDISRNENDPVILHHHNQYSGYFPIWVIVEYLSFHTISKYFTCLQVTDRKNIALKGFGINEYYFEKWIHSLSVMRNICAHFGYLYKREYTVPISFGRDSQKYDGLGNTLFGIFYSAKKLSKNDLWNKFFTGILKTLEKETLISDYYFPTDFSSLEN